jgi:hypothetical protein
MREWLLKDNLQSLCQEWTRHGNCIGVPWRLSTEFLWEEPLMSTATSVRPEDVLPVRSRINWGAIFAGAAMALASYFVLTLLGTAIGLSVQDRVRPENLSIGAALWALVTMMIALFIGGVVTSKCTVGENKGEAAIHGIIMWAVLFASILFLVAAGMRAGFNALVGASSLAHNAAPDLTSQDWEAAARRAGIPQERLDQWRRQAADLPPDTRRAAEEPANAEAASRALMIASWWALGGTVLSMLAAMGGALVGSGPRFYLLRINRTNPTVAVVRQVPA